MKPPSSPRRGPALAAALLALALAPAVASAQTGTATVAEVAPTTSATAAAVAAGLVRETRPPREVGLNPGRLLLRLPGHFIELAFTPLLPIAVAIERYHVIGRLLDLLTNDEKTLALVPIFDPFNGSGMGFGASLIYNEPLGSADRLVLLGLIRTNRDRSFSISFGRRFPSLSGRTVSFSSGYSADHDTRYFGIGADRTQDDLRIMRTDNVNASLGITLLNPARLPEWDGELSLGYRRVRLGVGSGDRAPLLVDNDTIPLPPGFGESLDYPEVRLAFRYDSRDSLGRTTRGSVAEVAFQATQDMNGGQTSAFRTDLTFATFLPILPLYRTIFLSFGAAAALPTRDGHRAPLHQLVNLGGGARLRSYVNDRYIDRLGWWATAEYRFRFYEYAASSMQLSAAMFVDVGKVGREPIDLVKGDLPWSLGIALRGEQNLVLLGRVQAAIGPEGFRFSVGFGEVL